MMPALRTLLRPWQVPAFAPLFMPWPHCVNACRHALHGDAQLGENSFMQSPSDDTYRQHVDNAADTYVTGLASENTHSAPDTCRQDAKAPFSHVKSYTEAPSCGDPFMQGLDKFSSAVSQTLKPRVSSRQNALKCMSQGSVQHNDNADDSAFAPASDSKDKHFEALVTRCKGHKCLQSATASEAFHRKVSLLESEQVSLCHATTLRKSRAFKSTSFEHLAAVLKVLKELLCSGEKAGQALAMNPGVLLQPIENLEQKLKVMADFKITEAVVQKLCTSKNVLAMKVESIHKMLSFFKDIGLNVEGRNKVLCKQPTMLFQSSEASILHALNFFTSLGMTMEQILLLIQIHPSVFLLSVDNNLREKYLFFQHLGFSMNEITRAIRCGLPQLSMETLQVKFKFLKDEGFADSDVLLLVSRKPGIILLSSEAVKRKLDFLLCEQKYDMADIVKWPDCLLCSLQGRMIPRFKALEENGLCKCFGLHIILGCTDLNFLKLTERKMQ